MTSKEWKNFFSNLYKSGKEFYIRSGYGSIYSLNYRIEKVKKIREKYFQNKRIMILDIGCGIGNFVQFLGEKYIGVDFSYEALKEHKQKYGKPVFVADAQYLPFKSNQFDFVVAVEVSQYMDDHKAFLYEISRILKENGIAVIISPNPDSLFWIIRQKLKGKSPLHFISINQILENSPLLCLEYLDGVFPIWFWNTFELFLKFIPRPVKHFLIFTLSKSFVVVMRKRG